MNYWHWCPWIIRSIVDTASYPRYEFHTSHEYYVQWVLRRRDCRLHFLSPATYWRTYRSPRLNVKRYWAFTTLILDFERRYSVWKQRCPELVSNLIFASRSQYWLCRIMVWTSQLNTQRWAVMRRELYDIILLINFLRGFLRWCYCRLISIISLELYT